MPGGCRMVERRRVMPSGSTMVGTPDTVAAAPRPRSVSWPGERGGGRHEHGARGIEHPLEERAGPLGRPEGSTSHGGDRCVCGCALDSVWPCGP